MEKGRAACQQRNPNQCVPIALVYPSSRLTRTRSLIHVTTGRETVAGDDLIPDTTFEARQYSPAAICQRITPRRPRSPGIQSAYLHQGETAGEAKERWERTLFVIAESQPSACASTTRTSLGKPCVAVFTSAGHRCLGRHRQGGYEHTRSGTTRSWGWWAAKRETESREGQRLIESVERCCSRYEKHLWHVLQSIITLDNVGKQGEQCLSGC